MWTDVIKLEVVVDRVDLERKDAMEETPMRSESLTKRLGMNHER